MGETTGCRVCCARFWVTTLYASICATCWICPRPRCPLFGVSGARSRQQRVCSSTASDALCAYDCSTEHHVDNYRISDGGGTIPAVGILATSDPARWKRVGSFRARWNFWRRQSEHASARERENGIL